MAEESKEFGDLDAVFRAARAAAPAPSGDLMARILADAAAVQPRPGAPARPAPRRAGWLRLKQVFLPALGGPGVVAGLACAVVAGAWIGFVQPAPLMGLASQVTGQSSTLDQVDLIPALDSYLISDSGATGD